MKIHAILPNHHFYSATDYLVLGEWNRLHNVNTLIDAGGEADLVQKIEMHSTGFGKQPVEQVILTHSHFDHTSGLKYLVKKYQPKIFSFASTPYTTHSLKDGETMAVADENFEIMHAPFHSQDSICLYCRKHQVLFSGDIPLQIRTVGGSYPHAFVDFLAMLIELPLQLIYPGHNQPLQWDLKSILSNTLENVKRSQLF